MNESAAPESKARRFARFLQDYVQMRIKTVRDVDNYEEVLWLGDLPDCAGCILAARGQQDLDHDDAQEGIWVEVHKQDVPDSPTPKPVLEPWFEDDAFLDPKEDPPPLKPRALVPDPDFDTSSGGEAPLVMREVSQHPNVRAAYGDFVTEWRSWADRSRNVRAVQDAYTRLFRIHTNLQREGEILELRLAFGLLDWPKPKIGGAVRRHVVSSSVELRFSPKDGVIRIECPTEGAKLTLEDEMLDGAILPARACYDDVGRQLEELGDSVWDKQRITTALQTWGRSLHPGLTWSEGYTPVRGEDDKPALAWAPALVLRKRGQTGMLRVYDAIIKQLDGVSDGEVPPGWRALIEDMDDRHGGGRGGGGDRGAEPGRAGGSVNLTEEQEVFFPLPANRQQRQIAMAIRERRGVLVQGPPGTGKSHTIANLMCHLLATGQRVLVTAENPRALGVLKEKLPKELAPLCISVLGQGGDAFAELNATVQDIASRRNRWDASAAADRIQALRRDLEDSRMSSMRLERELRELREGEVIHCVASPGYEGPASGIAQKVSDRRDEFGWLALEESDRDEPPVSDQEALTWFEASSGRDEEAVAQAAGMLPDSAELPPAPHLASLITDERDLNVRLAAFGQERERPELTRLSSSTAELLEGLSSELRELGIERGKLHPSPWVDKSIEAFRCGSEAEWVALLKASQDELDKIDRFTEAIGKSEIRLPADRDPQTIQTDATAVLEHLRAGGRWKALGGLLTPKPVRGRTYLLDEVAVDGSAADEPHELEAVIAATGRLMALRRFEALWSDEQSISEASDTRMRIASCRERVKSLAAALEHGQRERNLRSSFESVTATTLAGDSLQRDSDAWQRLIAAAILEQRRLQVYFEISELERSLASQALLHHANRIIQDIHDSITERNVTLYGELLDQLARHNRVLTRESERLRIRALLSEQAPTLLERIEAELDDSGWRARLLDLEAAWSWAAADRWLVRRGDLQRATRLEVKRRQAAMSVIQFTSELAAELAWKHFFERLSPAENNALKSWREAVRQMGKGTGRSAKMERLRRSARHYMEACRDAVPVWIMPRYLVAEMIQTSPEHFDTVIVDEASQLGVGGLFLFYVGKRLVVVGDDQQISPSEVGVSDDAVEGKRLHWIEDVPHPHLLSARSSVYANAHVRFGTSVTLREHFRCMPEIIQFSNDLCYVPNDTPLDPLRNYNSDRLTPLKSTFVEGGKRTGSSNSARNEPEAKMLVETLVQCLEDPAYKGKTFGIISLQGPTQARIIEKMLLQRVDPETFEARRILCGDSYAFQGDERHVIFLSMVVAPGETRISALTSATFTQRFNVAASRAQDQMWLFHSVQPSDLKPECLRYKLIDYVRSPSRRIADQDKARFDSPFERAVYERIVQRGYRVLTQVAVGDPGHRYRIDLVVEGLASRLAVECDGDKWHGPEQYEADMARQRDLERVGWEFVRIAGSAFYRDAAASLEPLWSELDRRGIFPASRTAKPEDDINRLAGSTTHVSNKESQEEQREEAKHGEGPRAEGASARDEESQCEGGQQHSEARHQPGPGIAVEDEGPPKDEAATGESASESVDRLPDPRTAPLADVRQSLVELVRVHGPIPCTGAYQRYIHGAGFRKLGKVLREALERAIRSAERAGLVELESERGTRRADRIVRSAGTPAVRLRQVGDRSFEEIPPSEFAAAMLDNESGAQNLMESVRDDVYRRVLQRYTFTSLTQGRREVLDIAWEIAKSSHGNSDSST